MTIDDRIINPVVGMGRIMHNAEAAEAAEAALEDLRAEISAHNGLASVMSVLDSRHPGLFGVGVERSMTPTGEFFTDGEERAGHLDAEEVTELEEALDFALAVGALMPRQRPDLYSPGVRGRLVLEAQKLLGSFQAIENFRPHDAHDEHAASAFAVHIEGRTRTMLYVDADSSVQRKMVRRGIGE